MGYPDTKPETLSPTGRRQCTFIPTVGGARLQSASHPSSGLAHFEVKWCSAIVFNGLQVNRRLAFGRRIAPSQLSIDSTAGFRARRANVRQVALPMFPAVTCTPASSLTSHGKWGEL